VFQSVIIFAIALTNVASLARTLAEAVLKQNPSDLKRASNMIEIARGPYVKWFISVDLPDELYLDIH